MKRVVSFAAVVMLVLAACGGGEAETVDDVVNVDSDPEEVVDDTQDALDVAQEANEAANAEAEGGTATVTLNGETYEFMSFEEVPVQRCDPDFFGGFWVILLDDADMLSSPNSVEMAFPGGDYTDPPRVIVMTDAGESEWIADEADVPEGVPAPNIQWTVDGNSVSGSATAYEENSFFAFRAGTSDELATAELTFEASC